MTKEAHQTKKVIPARGVSLTDVDQIFDYLSDFTK